MSVKFKTFETGERVFVLGVCEEGIVQVVRKGFSSRKVDLSSVRVRLDSGCVIEARFIDVLKVVCA